MLKEEVSNMSKIYRKMRQGTGGHAFVALLKVCAKNKDLHQGSRIHADMARLGLLAKDVAAGSALVSMYGKCGSLAKAQEVFDKIPVPNVVCWNALIAGYAQQSHSVEALKCFEQMQCGGFSPNAVTFTCILKACGSIQAGHKGQEIHIKLVREGLLGKDVVVGTALIDMYAKCGMLAKAQDVFDKLQLRDVVTWSALIAGYAQHGYFEEALNCFERMQLDGLSPDACTFVCSLKACGNIGAKWKGQLIHSQIVRQGLLEKHCIVGTALVDMYAKCGLLAKAQEVFDNISVRDAVSWSALIAGYAQHGHSEEALGCFERMKLEGISPDAVTFVFILKACGSLGAVNKGQELHAEIVRGGFFVAKHTVVGTALVDMYGKLGLLATAQAVFDKLSFRDVVSWSTLITGYSLLGKAEDVFSSFDKMVRAGVRPDLITFTSVLNACSHAGLLDKGKTYFDTISTSYGLLPTLEHHTCMVDLFCRSGCLDKAVLLIEKMPFSANLAVWHVLLGACRMWGDVDVGRLAFECTMQLDEKDAEAYVCMSYIYSDAGRQEDADMVQAMRLKNQALRKSGYC